MPGPEAALAELTRELRSGDPVIAPNVVEASEQPHLGLLVAAGPRAAAAPGAYAQVIESVREGYLLHYSDPRLIETADRDLALLAGDYMYASGLSLLASLGDLEAVRELAELISLCAQAHTDAEGAADVPALWLAGAVAIGTGSGPEHTAAKQAVREGRPSLRELWDWAASAAGGLGLSEQLDAAAETVGFPPSERR